MVFSILCISKIFSACSNSKNEILPVTNLSTNQLTGLGRYLFFDRRLSINNTRACGTCHNPQFAFTDGYKRSFGAFADVHQRNTSPLFNLASQKYFTAADSTLHTALQQMENPLYSTHPIEMGVKGNEIIILKRIASDTLYKKLFTDANLGINWPNIKIAIANFVMSISSNNSAYDKFVNGNTTALTQQQKAGMQLFFSESLNCSSCHGGKNFNLPSHKNEQGDTIYFFNTGLYNIDNKSSYPLYDQGLVALTNNNLDMGAYKVPTLRNLAFTAPYLHDGSAATLSEVVHHYTKGGRVIEKGTYAGNGIKNKYKHPAIKGFALSDTEKQQLISFLFALNDSEFIQNSMYTNPFLDDETKR